MDNEQQLPPWSNRYIPTIISVSDAEVCKLYGWVSPEVDSVNIVIRSCTKQCGRKQGADEKTEFFTCTSCKSGMGFAKAKKIPFVPKAIVPVRHDCIGDCGRWVIAAQADQVGWLCCSVCATSLRSFMQCMNGERRHITRGRNLRRHRTVKRKVK